MEHIYEAASSSSASADSSSAYDFVKGFITGQLALLALLLLIVRLLFFRSAVGTVITPPTTVKLDSRIFPKLRKFKKVLAFGQDAQLLERLFDLNPQLLKGEASKLGSPEVLISDESARWLTFLLAKLLVDPLRLQMNGRVEEISLLLQARLIEKISNSSKYASLDELKFKTLQFGPSYPQIEAYQLVYDTQQEFCAFRVRCSWRNVFKVEVESSLRLAGLISLPFVLGVEVKTARFTAQMQLVDDELQVFCLPDEAFLLELEIGSLVGHRTKLKDLPKITAAIVEGIKKVLIEMLIHPQSIKIPLTPLTSKLFDFGRSDGVDLEESNDIDENHVEETVDVFEEDDDDVGVGVGDDSFALTEESAPLLVPGRSYSSIGSIM